MAKVIHPDLSETYEARYPRKPKDVCEAIRRIAKHAGVVLESNASVRARQEVEYKRVMEERETAKTDAEAARRLAHEITMQTKPGATIGWGIENRFTETVNEFLPSWLNDKINLTPRFEKFP